MSGREVCRATLGFGRHSGHRHLLQTKFRSAHILSAIVAILAIVVSAGGLFIGDLYRDSALVTAGWFGNDLVTLVVAVPVLVTALILSMRGSLRAQLVWLGMLGYTLYNYAFYLFGAAFNRFFLLYVALFALSIFALIFALTKLDVDEVGRRFRARTSVKWISGYMLFVAVGLGGVEIAQSLSFVVTGRVPQVIVDVTHPTAVIFALDLSLVVPFFVLGAIWLWKHRPWGYVLGAVLNVKGAVYTLALVATSVSAARAGFPEAAAQIPIWGFLLVGSLIASGLLLGNVRSAQSGERGEFR